MPRRRQDAEQQQEETVPVTVRYPKDLHARALAVAKAEDRTFASLVTYALRRYVTDREREMEP